MNNLSLIENTLNGEAVPTINARDLHQELEVGRMYQHWIKDRIEKYGFMEGVEFLPILAKTSSFLGGRPKTEYFLTLDMAKHIALMENNAKGREIRNSLIEAERKLREDVPALVNRLRAENNALSEEKHELQCLVGAQQENLELSQVALSHQQAAKGYEQKYIALLEETLEAMKNEKPRYQIGAKQGKPGIPLSDKEKRTIVRLYQQGFSNRQIQQQVNRSRTAIQQVLKVYRDHSQQGGQG